MFLCAYFMRLRDLYIAIEELNFFLRALSFLNQFHYNVCIFACDSRLNDFFLRVL